MTTIVDDYSRECPAIEVDTSLDGVRVVGVLERLEVMGGLPEVITMDNGPEFTGQALDEWAYRKGVRLNFIRPGKPIENAYAKSFIGRLRDESGTKLPLSLHPGRTGDSYASVSSFVLGCRGVSVIVVTPIDCCCLGAGNSAFNTSSGSLSAIDVS